MDDLISKEQAIDKITKRLLETAFNNVGIKQNVDETLVDVAENRLGNWFDELPSAEPCGDAVSRNGIVQKLNKMDRYVSAELRLCDTDKIFPQNEVFIVDDVYEEIVEQLPSVQPETNCSEIPNNWIPCSERMPEEHEWIGTKRFGTTISDEVYVTFEAPDGQRFTDHISFQNGKLSRSDEHRMKVVYKGAKPIAWMPLPEPYQEGEQE